MVFVTVGSTNNDFARLFRWVDDMVEQGLLCDVLAQVGSTVYQPSNYLAIKSLSSDEMRALIIKAEFIISHGGAATLDECLGFRKKVILVPRRARYMESPDDHQLEIAEHLVKMNRVLIARDKDELQCRVAQVADWQPVFSNKRSTRTGIVTAIQEFIESLNGKKLK